jgi:hypothetical protein
MAGWFVVVGSVMLLITVYSTLASLNSVETRDRVSEWVSSPTGDSLGLSVADALSGLRAALMVSGLCAAAAGVFGVFVLQRHRGARIGLSVVAVPILVANLVTAPLTGGLLGALIAAATIVLWTGPARDWFAGRPIRQPPAPERRETSRPVDPPPPPPQTPPVDLSTQQPSAQPAATSGFGERPAHQETNVAPQPWAPPTGLPIGWNPPVSLPMPTHVKVACLLTWAFSGVVAAVYAVMLVILVVNKDQLVDYVVRSPGWQQANIDPDLLVPVLWVGCLMFFGWSAGAVLLAWFTWRRHNWARYILVASAACAALAGLFAFPFSIPHLVACVLAIVALFTAQSRAWFAQPTRGQWPPQGPTQGPPPGPPRYEPQQGPPPGPPQSPPQYEPPQPTSPPPPPGPPKGQQGKPPVW